MALVRGLSKRRATMFRLKIWCLEHSLCLDVHRTISRTLATITKSLGFLASQSRWQFCKHPCTQLLHRDRTEINGTNRMLQASVRD